MLDTHLPKPDQDKLLQVVRKISIICKIAIRGRSEQEFQARDFGGVEVARVVRDDVHRPDALGLELLRDNARRRA